MYFGVDYYPEHWVFPYAGTEQKPEELWEKDVELMLAAGINVVRMGEFTWGLCEPEEGKFDFEWLQRSMELLGKAGIDIVLATPTAAPPIWLAQKYPEILPLDEQGRTLHAGTRRAVCLNCNAYWDSATTQN
jgi:beta-galactosidase